MAGRTKSLSNAIRGAEGPLANSYLSAVVMVVFALTPFLILSSGTAPLAGSIAHDVSLSSAGMELSGGLADAAYCFGTVMAVQLLTRLPGRRLLVIYAALFAVSSMAAAAATSPGVFIGARVIQALTTSLMLITAAPALVLGWPERKLVYTGAVMNLGIFGAVALGPVIGGAFIGFGGWRAFFWVMAGVAAIAATLSVLTFRDQPPQDPEVPIDGTSLVLAASGCLCAFFGAANLGEHSFTSAIVLLPLLGGIALLGALIVHQVVVRDPLMPVRNLGHTIPIAAVILAMGAGAASVGMVGLLRLVIEDRGISNAVFWPEFAGAILTAFLFGGLFFSRLVPLLPLAGLAVLTVTAGFAAGMDTASETALFALTFGIGLGVGASVAPGLFVAGFTLPARLLPRVFALVELLRGVAAFLTAPLVVHLALNYPGGQAAGISLAVWILFGLLAVSLALVVLIVLAGGFRLQAPRIGLWLSGRGTALDSPRLWHGFRITSGDRLKGVKE